MIILLMSHVALENPKTLQLRFVRVHKHIKMYSIIFISYVFLTYLSPDMTKQLIKEQRSSTQIMTVTLTKQILKRYNLLSTVN